MDAAVVAPERRGGQALLDPRLAADPSPRPQLRIPLLSGSVSVAGNEHRLLQ